MVNEIKENTEVLSILSLRVASEILSSSNLLYGGKESENFTNWSWVVESEREIFEISKVSSWKMVRFIKIQALAIYYAAELWWIELEVNDNNVRLVREVV